MATMKQLKKEGFVLWHLRKISSVLDLHKITLIHYVERETTLYLILYLRYYESEVAKDPSVRDLLNNSKFNRIFSTCLVIFLFIILCRKQSASEKGHGFF